MVAVLHTLRRLVVGHLADRGGQDVGCPVRALRDRARLVAQRGGHLGPGLALQQLRVVLRAVDQVLAAQVDERDGTVLAGLHVGRVVVLAEQLVLRAGRRLQVAALGQALRLHRGERQVLAGVVRAEEGQRRGARVHVGAGRVDAVQPGERAEPAQRLHHGPPLGRAVRAVLGAHVEDLGLAARGQRGRADRGHGLGVRAAAADGGQRRGRHRGDVLDHAGRERGAGHPARRAGRAATLVQRLDEQKGDHDDHDANDAANGQEHPVPDFLLPLRRPLRGNLFPGACLLDSARLTHVPSLCVRRMPPARLHRRAHHGVRPPRWRAAGVLGNEPFPAAQAAIWAREVKPSLARIFATCRAAVAGLITSSPAMARLL